MKEEQLNEISKILKINNKNISENKILEILIEKQIKKLIMTSQKSINIDFYEKEFFHFLKYIKYFDLNHDFSTIIEAGIEVILEENNGEDNLKTTEMFHLCFTFLLLQGWKVIKFKNDNKKHNNEEIKKFIENIKNDKNYQNIKGELNKLYDSSSLKSNELRKMSLLLLNFLENNFKKIVHYIEEEKENNFYNENYSYFEQINKEAFLIIKDLTIRNFCYFEDFVLRNDRNNDFKNLRCSPKYYDFYIETLSKFYSEENDKKYFSLKLKDNKKIISDINRNLIFKKSSKQYFYGKLLSWFDKKILQKSLLNLLLNIYKNEGKIIFKLNNEDGKEITFTEAVEWINNSLNKKPFIDYLLSLIKNDENLQTKDGFLQTKSQEKIIINLLINYFYLTEARNKNRKKDEIEVFDFQAKYIKKDVEIKVHKKTETFDDYKYFSPNRDHFLYKKYNNIVPEEMKTVIEKLFEDNEKNYYTLRYKISENTYYEKMAEVISIYCLKNNFKFIEITDDKVCENINLFDLVIYNPFPVRNKYQINEEIANLLENSKLYEKKIIFIIPDLIYQDEEINKHHLNEIKIEVKNKNKYKFFQKQRLNYVILSKYQKDFSKEEMDFLINFFFKNEIYERKMVLKLISKILLRNKKVFNVNLNELLEQIKNETLPSYIKVEKPKTYLSQVMGLDKEKQLIKTYLNKFKENIKHKQDFDEIGENVKITNKKLAILLEGSSGTGKTMLSKAIANEINVPFLSVSGGVLFESVDKIREIFHEARRMSPCVLFIDEVDCWGNRLKSKSNEHDIKISCLLNELDNAENNKNVFIIATCNYKNQLDPSLLREGRFNQIIKVKEPSFEQRKEFFKIQFPNFKEHEIESVTKKFIGKNFAQIKNITEIYLFQTKEDDVNYKNLLEFLDEYYFGKTMDIKITKETAYHEMGHAFLSYILKHGKMELSKVSIIPRESYIGVAQHNYTEDYPLHNRMDYISQIILCLGGICAEKTFCDDLSTGASSDLQMATAIAETMVKSLGLIRLWENLDDLDNFHLPLYKDGGFFGGNDSSEKQKEKIEEEVNYIIRFCLKFTLDLMKKYQKEIDKMANILFEKEELLYSEFKEEMDKLNMKENSEVINFK